MKNEIEIKDNIISFKNVKVKLPNVIEDFLIFENKIIIRYGFNTKNREKVYRNIFAFNFDGELLWKIPADPNWPSWPYVSIGKKGNELIAINYSGLRAIVDIDVGVFKHMEYRK